MLMKTQQRNNKANPWEYDRMKKKNGICSFFRAWDWVCRCWKNRNRPFFFQEVDYLSMRNALEIYCTEREVDLNFVDFIFRALSPVLQSPLHQHLQIPKIFCPFQKSIKKKNFFNRNWYTKQGGDNTENGTIMLIDPPTFNRINESSMKFTDLNLLLRWQNHTLKKIFYETKKESFLSHMGRILFTFPKKHRFRIQRLLNKCNKGCFRKDFVPISISV
jgi:hypothetical protein